MKCKRLFFLALVAVVGVSFFTSFAPLHKVTSARIPVIFSTHPWHPLVVAKVQGKDYFLNIDTGGSGSLYLGKSDLQRIEKYKTGEKTKIADCRGNVYEWPIYSVPDIQIGSLQLKNGEIIEESSDFSEHTNLWSPFTPNRKRDSHGRMGQSFFRKSCCLIDFPNSSIYLSQRIEDLKKDGLIDLNNFIAVPFTNESLIDAVISIETDLGIQRVVLDTGTTYSLLRKEKLEPSKLKKLPSEGYYFPSNKLVIQGCDFGAWEFASTDMWETLPIDGLLGAEFFIEHAVCFDFPNQMIYIKKPQNALATQWKRAKFRLTQFYLRNFTNLSKGEDL